MRVSKVRKLVDEALNEGESISDFCKRINLQEYQGIILFNLFLFILD